MAPDPKPQPRQAPASIPAGTTLPDGVTEDDIKNPDNKRNLICMSYIEKRLAQQQAKIKGYTEREERIPPAERQLLMDLTFMKGMNENSIAQGKLTEAMYGNLVNLQLAKDQRLLPFLEKYGFAS